MLRIDQIKLPVGHNDGELTKKLEKILKLDNVKNDQRRYSCRIIRRSLDARRKPELFYVYSVSVELDPKEEERILKRSRGRFISKYEPKVYHMPEPEGMNELKGRPVIAGTGPAGLFCAYILCQNGYAPILLERGEQVEDRIDSVNAFWKSGRLNPSSNVQFGEGGAGTFSDGKLNTLVNDKNGRNRFVLDTFVKFGAPKEIGFCSKPHLGTDNLTDIVRNMRTFITHCGGSFCFNTKLTDIAIQEGHLINVKAESVQKNGSIDEVVIDTNCLIAAIGHSARDTFGMFNTRGVSMSQKNFAVGLRIQHPQKMINELQYGRTDNDGLPAADYKLTNRTQKGRNVYTFCMCPGGYVVNASSEEGRLAVNGMSYSGRDSLNANSAVIVSVDKKDFGSEDVLAGLKFQRDLEEKAYRLGNGDVPVQKYGDYKDNVLTAEPGDVIPQIKGRYRMANLRELFSEDINEAIIESIDKFGYTMEGFDRADAILAGVESRTSSPVRINRDDGFMSNIVGLYPCGEGAGYAGGITSAAIDGIKVAEAVMKHFRPYDESRNELS